MKRHKLGGQGSQCVSALYVLCTQRFRYRYRYTGFRTVPYRTSSPSGEFLDPDLGKQKQKKTKKSRKYQNEGMVLYVIIMLLYV
jgi:hypothetical protein